MHIILVQYNTIIKI